MSDTREFLGSFVLRDEPSPVIGVAWMTKEEQIEQDPFNGNGVRLDIGGTANPADLTDAALDLFGLPCTAWDCCVWVDLTDAALTADDARKKWSDALVAGDVGLPANAGEMGKGECAEPAFPDRRRDRSTGGPGDIRDSPDLGSAFPSQRSGEG